MAPNVRFAHPPRGFTLLLAALAAGPTVGCVRGFNVHTTVTARAEGAPRPVAGAAVSMNCPQAIKNDRPSFLARTDALGELSFHEPVLGRWIHNNCELIIEAPGFQTKHVAVADVCKEYNLNRCVHVELHAVLVPTAPAP